MPGPNAGVSARRSAARGVSLTSRPHHPDRNVTMLGKGSRSVFRGQGAISVPLSRVFPTGAVRPFATPVCKTESRLLVTTAQRLSLRDFDDMSARPACPLSVLNRSPVAWATAAGLLILRVPRMDHPLLGQQHLLRRLERRPLIRRREARSPHLFSPVGRNTARTEFLFPTRSPSGWVCSPTTTHGSWCY